MILLLPWLSSVLAAVHVYLYTDNSNAAFATMMVLTALISAKAKL